MAKFNVYAIEVNSCEGIDEVMYVAASNREEAIKTAAEEHPNEWRLQHGSDVMWLEGAVYEADKPCCIYDRLCCEDGIII